MANQRTKLMMLDGHGRSFDRSIMVEFIDELDYEKIEMAIIHQLYALKNTHYKIMDKRLTRYDGKMYDIIKVISSSHTPRANVVTIDILYFDISLFWNE